MIFETREKQNCRASKRVCRRFSILVSIHKAAIAYQQSPKKLGPRIHWNTGLFSRCNHRSNDHNAYMPAPEYHCRPLRPRSQSTSRPCCLSASEVRSRKKRWLPIRATNHNTASAIRKNGSLVANRRSRIFRHRFSRTDLRLLPHLRLVGDSSATTRYRCEPEHQSSIPFRRRVNPCVDRGISFQVYSQTDSSGSIAPAHS